MPCLVMSDSLTLHGPYIAQEAPLPWGFSRQEYWSGLPCPPPGDLFNPGIKLRSPTLQANSLLDEPPGKSKNTRVSSLPLLPNPRIELVSPALQADSLPAELVTFITIRQLFPFLKNMLHKKIDTWIIKGARRNLTGLQELPKKQFLYHSLITVVSSTKQSE